MGFKTDNGGLKVAIKDAKLTTTESASTWNTRLSQIGSKQKNKRIIICTYSLPDIKYMKQILDKRSSNVIIIANKKFKYKADILENIYPDLKVYLREDCHAKMVLIEPETVWLSSANFGRSNWFEHTIGIHSEEVYEFYLKEIKRYIRKNK